MAGRFASKMGRLAGNYFITIESRIENAVKLAQMTLREGAQPILI